MSNQFLTNYSEITFLEKIKDSLRKCNSFSFSVSFIKKAGLILLFNDIEAAVMRGAKGKIITSTYQNFTDIESLKMFISLQNKHENFLCHLDYECFHDSGYSTLGYHSKGYLFEFDDSVELIVGSSNITHYALLKNIEWDVVINEDKNSSVYAQALSEFEDKWDNTHSLNSEIINLYSNKLNFAVERWDMDYDLSTANIKPNFMQRKALKELNRYRAIGTSRALVVAAAGSGKTYLAAFDAQNFNPRRLLYVVHEGSILKKSLETFQDVFGSSVTYGILGSGNKDFDEDFIFATVQSLTGKMEHNSEHRNFELFNRRDFDYIIIDECHHSSADTYKMLINYFEPEFLIGLTATPERMDNEDVFELFDKNVPYELRLRDAIINGLVVPFKYYGIRDEMVNYNFTKSEERKAIAQLATVDHCNFITKEIEKHRPEGKIKALAFCRNTAHARMMCETMSEHYKCAYLTGRNDIGERIRAYNDLQNDETDLEILFTVDILNEGVDIPGVNMVLFLRPTESSTIFIQQLGRGLRKFPEKEYVTVLDFIGNSYKRSVQIAFALSSLAENFVVEKSLMMNLVRDNFLALGLADYGVEINIDSLSKEEIIQNLETENFNAITYIKQDYYNFKKYIGSEYYPKHMDYLNNDCAPDLIRFMSIKIGGKKTSSYYNFLQGIEEENLPTFSDNQISFISYLSAQLPLVREYEYVITKVLLNGKKEISDLERIVSVQITNFNVEEFKHAIKYMFKDKAIIVLDNRISLNCETDRDYNEYVLDLIEYGLKRYSIDYMNCSERFVLWHSYRMDQVQRKRCIDPGYTAVGTYYDEDKNVFIFASIHKDASTAEHLMYNDKFLEPNVFQWESMAGLTERDENRLSNSKCVFLFIRKVSEEHGITLPFTYVGKGHINNPRVLPKRKRTILYDIHMENSLPDYLQYDFGLSQSEDS